jgi:hypothetical protein
MGLLKDADRQLDTIASSRSLGLAVRLQRATRHLLPEGTRARRVAKAAAGSFYEMLAFKDRLKGHWRWQARSLAVDDEGRVSDRDYARWCREQDATSEDLLRQATAARVATRPLWITAIVLAEHDGPALQATVRSLHNQSWPYWDAHVVAGCDNPPDPLFAGPRVSVIAALDSETISAVNRVLSNESTDFVAFLEAGDELAPDCFYEVTTAARRDPLIDLIYWDDDIAGDHRSRPRFRPAWSPEVLISANYLHRSFAILSRLMGPCASERADRRAG